MAGNFFRGTTVDQDGRWGKSDEKLMAKMQKAGKFAAILDTKIDIKKVNIDIISKWVSEKTIEVLGFEDEIVINLVINMLQSEKLHGKKMQLDVTGFLEKGAGQFVEELWTLLVDAQSQPNGIPEAFIRKKKEEILRRQEAIKMVTNAALQQSSLSIVQPREETQSGRWGPHSSAPIMSSEMLQFATTIEGQKTESSFVAPESSEDQSKKADVERSLPHDEGQSSRHHRHDDDYLRSDKNRDERNSKSDRRRNRSRSVDRRDRDGDHRDHGRHHERRDSGRTSHRERDRSRDRERDRSRDRDRHSRRDRSRERHRSRKDDRGDSRRDRGERDSSADARKSRRRGRSNSEDYGRRSGKKREEQPHAEGENEKESHKVDHSTEEHDGDERKKSSHSRRDRDRSSGSNGDDAKNSDEEQKMDETIPADGERDVDSLPGR
jgi:serine/arginine repetitive matrix protein 1